MLLRSGIVNEFFYVYNFLTFFWKDFFVWFCKWKGDVFKVQSLFNVNVVFWNILRNFLFPISLLFKDKSVGLSFLKRFIWLGILGGKFQVNLENLWFYGDKKSNSIFLNLLLLFTFRLDKTGLIVSF